MYQRSEVDVYLNLSTLVLMW